MRAVLIEDLKHYALGAAMAVALVAFLALLLPGARAEETHQIRPATQSCHGAATPCMTGF